MKTINKASIVFLLIDEFSKNPITDAEIKCLGENFSYTKKNNGYYVFLNVAKGIYNFNVLAKGYLPFYCKVEVEDEDYPVEVIVPLKYSQGNINIMGLNKIIFTLKNKEHENSIIKNKEVKIRLDTKVPTLRVIEPIARNKNSVSINFDYNKGLLYQEYRYEKKPALNVFFTGYDHVKNCYLMKEPSKSKVAEGGLLSPVWHFVTDQRGSFMLPINPLFMQKDTVNFVITVGRKNANVTAETKKTSYIDVNV